MASIDSGLSTANKANVDSNYNLQVNLPTIATQAGYVQLTYAPSSSINKTARNTTVGEALSTTPVLLFEEEFNTSSASFSSRWGTNVTTMTAVAANGWMRLNSSAITNTATGVSMYTYKTFKRSKGSELRVQFTLKHTNAIATNKQADFGLGYYGFATGQAAAMNEFIGFRFTTGGGFEAVLESTTGGAATTQTVNINGNVPYSDGFFRRYELIITEGNVEYWAQPIAGDPLILVAVIERVAEGNFAVTKSAALPIMMRVFNSGVASAAATFDIGAINIHKYGGESALPHPTQMSSMGKSSFYHQPDLVVAATQPHVFPNTGTSAPSVIAGNAAAAIGSVSQMGGLFQLTGSAITATAESNIIVSAFQNPVIPTATGAPLNNRNFICTGITIQPLIVNVVLAGGGFVATWFVGVGGTTVSLATTDTNGTTLMAAKGSRLVPLSTTDSLVAAAVAGTVSTRDGDSTIEFTTPVIVSPGEFLHVGFRTRYVAAAITSGNLQGGVYVHGYWE
jgi:hypothetical protein